MVEDLSKTVALFLLSMLGGIGELTGVRGKISIQAASVSRLIDFGI